MSWSCTTPSEVKTYVSKLQLFVTSRKHNILYRGLTGKMWTSAVSLSNHALEARNMYGVLISNILDSETTLNPNFR